MGVANKRSIENLKSFRVRMIQRQVHDEERRLVDEFIDNLPLTQEALSEAKIAARKHSRKPANQK